MNPENLQFLAETYNLNSILWALIAVALFDLILKGWGMWRAARMQKRNWFIALLVMNTAGILPIIFLWMTNDKYKKMNT